MPQPARRGAVTALLAVLTALVTPLPAASAAGMHPSAAATQRSAAATPSVSLSSAGTLPFDLPVSALRRSPKKVFAHYFPPLPMSLDNASPARDYYARNYLDPDGEKGKHRAYGGHLRDRPMQRAPRSGSDWRLADMQDEVRQAVAGGLDGFAVDLLALRDDPNVRLWENAKTMLRAAETAAPGFQIMIMPDMTNRLAQKTPAVVAASIAELGRSDAAYRLADGRLVVAPFLAEARPPSWWAEFLDVMRDQHRTRVAFLPVFLNERKHAAAFQHLTWGMSIWGSRNPGHNDPDGTGRDTPRGRAAAVKRLGQAWMQPVSVQDARPRTGIFDEAQNTTNLRTTWQIARASDAELVQIPTWNDYTEGTQLAPSVKNGGAFLDVNAYYLSWYKTGSAPRVVRDTVYLTHRTQPHAARPSFPQSTLMRLRGGSPARDTVEALTFLTRPGKVTLHVGTRTHTCAVDAGVDTCVVPLGPGRVSAEVRRGGDVVAQVASPHLVSETPYVQDLQYVAASSRRPTSGWLTTPQLPVEAPVQTPVQTPVQAPVQAPAEAPTTRDRDARPSVEVRPAVLRAGQPAEVVVRAAPGDAVALWAYTRPSTALRLVRTGRAGADGRAVFTVRPSGSTRMEARVSGLRTATSRSVVLPVQAALHLAAVRTGPRTYVFSGRTMPAVAGRRVAVAYARGGTSVVAVSATTAADGTFRVRRTFTGTGALTFTARTAADLTNAAGASRPVRVVVR
ncbi:MAG: glycoside hydrolase family 71 protein [Actinomycetota bacterium]|nr:glycoside hydrolase family 71 protein [Actinomycetota bacterium]